MSWIDEVSEAPVEDPYVEIDKLGDEIAELSAHIDAATYRLLVLIREFDERHGWDAGFVSCAHWLSYRTGHDLGSGREKVRVAHALAKLPKLSEAFRKGEVSYSKARAITRVATPNTDQELLDAALGATASEMEKIVRAWRDVDADLEGSRTQKQQEGRYVTIDRDTDGTVYLRARLTPEQGSVVEKALQAAMDRLYDEEKAAKDKEVKEEAKAKDGSDQPAPVTGEMWGKRRADALALVAEAALKHDLDAGTRGDRYQVVVHVDAEVLADPRAAGQSVLEGHDVSAETSRRISCDASRVVMVHDQEGNVLDVGRKTKVIPTPIRRALDYRDNTCRFPGCNRRVCDAHHLKAWIEGGETKLSNLCLLCRFHHGLVHEGHFRVKRVAESELAFYWPDGRAMPACPDPPVVEGDPIETILNAHRLRGITIDAETSRPEWCGEPVGDWGLAISVLHPALHPPGNGVPLYVPGSNVE